MQKNECIICKNNKLMELFRNYTFDNTEYKYLKCRQCGFVFCFPLPTEDTLLKLYGSEYDYSWFEKRKKLKKLQARFRARDVKRIIHAGRKTLDIGCGHGFFVDSLSALGYKSFGYEYSKDSKIFQEDKKIYYTHSLANIPEDEFDFISAWHSIEHMLDPVSMLNQISSKLSRAGKVLIAVPNYSCIGQKLSGRSWVWLQEPYVHIWHFNPSNIHLLFEKSELRIEKVWTRDVWDAQIFDWSLKWGIAALKLLSGQRNREWFIFEEALRLLAIPISYALNPLHKLLGTGSEMIVLGSKR